MPVLGYFNTTGSGNSFVGFDAGRANSTGSNNTIIGNNANVAVATFRSHCRRRSAVVSSNNNVVLGRSVETVRIPGNLVVTGTVSKGGGSFRIDHPLDPENKYLYHSFVESPDMMNVYNGNIDDRRTGEAIVTLPDYFDALNRDFRYQLTVIGQFAQAIVGEEIKGNSFDIRTDKPGVKVSWQVTGIRKDKFANENRIQVEVQENRTGAPRTETATGEINMSSMIFNGKNTILLSIFLMVCSTNTISAQTTAFTYQGKLNNGSSPAAGNFDMQFRLFDDPDAGEGTQQGATVSKPAVATSNGVFSVQLDFGAEVFAAGADLYLEISLRSAGSSGGYTGLAPRQKITSAPYSIKSKSADTAATATNADNAANSANADNANQLGGLLPDRFVQYDLNGDVGIGAVSNGSKLTVSGVIESTKGGIKFPDATTQTTAGLTSVVTNSPLIGDGTSASPLGVASPLIVRDIDNPAFQPVQVSRDSTGVLVTVPDGKRLVIEFVSGYQFITASISPCTAIQLYSLPAAPTFVHYLAPSIIVPNGGINNCLVNQSMRMYVDEGRQVYVYFNPSQGTRYISITGYYIDVPPAAAKSNKK